MKKPRARRVKIDPETRYFLKNGGRRKHTHRDWLNVFLRVNNRKRYFTRDDVSAAGYPFADLTGAEEWREVHAWCQDRFGADYIWFGERFFFLNVLARDEFDKTWNHDAPSE